jgi:hypothetical protein
VALSAATDPQAEGPVLDLYLGNRCTESVWVDIPALQMTAYLDDGQEMPVRFYDPRDELKSAVLGGKELAMERLELDAPIETQRICAQIDGLARSSQLGPPQVLCMEVEGA